MLLDSEGRIRLTDFGLSRITIREQESVNMAELQYLGGLPRKKDKRIVGGTIKRNLTVNKDPLLGTPDYLAPELLFGIGNGPEVDLWAFGICLYEFMLGFPPFSDETPENIFRNILDYTRKTLGSEIEFPEEEDMSANARDLTEKLLTCEASTRIKIVDIKIRKLIPNADPYFSSIDWINVRKQKAPFIPQPVDQSDTSYFSILN
jgi:serine/threonine protein kinase